MSIKIYNKLVRDNIPAIIESSGTSCKYAYVKDDKYFRSLLLIKIIEECQEVIDANNKGDKQQVIEELADLKEVLNTLEKLVNDNDYIEFYCFVEKWNKSIDLIIETTKINKNKLTAIQEKKRQEKGGFDKRICLIYVEEQK